MRDRGDDGMDDNSSVNSAPSDHSSESHSRWNTACQRYADLWSGSVVQDWFRVFVFPSSDSEFLREIDLASEEPEISKAVAEAGGVAPGPQDLLISLGFRMGNRGEPNDPEVWAAIDVGQFVCFTHFGAADRRMGWEQKHLLTAATATVALLAHPRARHMTQSQIDAANAETTVVSKISVLTSYLQSLAAHERYLEDGPRQDPKTLMARLAEDHEITCQIIEAVGTIGMEKPVSWCAGPLDTVEIARKAADLLAEAHRQVVLPDIAPATVRPDAVVRPAPQPRPAKERAPRRSAA